MNPIHIDYKLHKDERLTLPVVVAMHGPHLVAHIYRPHMDDAPLWLDLPTESRQPLAVMRAACEGAEEAYERLAPEWQNRQGWWELFPRIRNAVPVEPDAGKDATAGPPVDREPAP